MSIEPIRSEGGLFVEWSEMRATWGAELGVKPKRDEEKTRQDCWQDRSSGGITRPKRQRKGGGGNKERRKEGRKGGKGEKDVRWFEDVPSTAFLLASARARAARLDAVNYGIIRIPALCNR